MTENSVSTMTVDTAERPTPRVHVVLPAFNEEGSLGGLLTRIAHLADRQPSDVWAIDDGSSETGPSRLPTPARAFWTSRW